MQKLASKFIEVMRDCSHISKNGKNDFHGYKYATSADVLERVNASLVAHGIASIATPELLNVVDVTTAKGNVEHLATVRMDITLIDKESGEVLSIGGIGSGQDDFIGTLAMGAGECHCQLCQLAVPFTAALQVEFILDLLGKALRRTASRSGRMA